ncbi:outer membrane protein assembly factor BamC [Methylomonas sp. UP202]|uniref:outer membrane protein assembly factor BamC n=1 Tax=Methylomonas sp. UP202 TaxID=3040943 RepID=UPI00247AD834|nr:outer membrane protein assembly factor BamC [Methylomonas sp. UP202]WGS86034.1 outer membrane protein assembly factor BamC [Methylomonas sp. UP202]
MLKTLRYTLPCLLLAGCADAPEKYRDIKHLELPPVLPIENPHPQPAIAADDLAGSKSGGKSMLAGLVDFKDDGQKPQLTLMTRLDRAWEMVETALTLSDIDIVDKNRNDNKIQVRYDPDTGGKTKSLLNRLFLDNDFPEAEYTISLTDAISGVKVNAALGKPDDFSANEDGSAALIRLLHDTIDKKIINRDEKAKPEE